MRNFSYLKLVLAIVSLAPRCNFRDEFRDEFEDEVRDLQKCTFGQKNWTLKLHFRDELRSHL